MIAPRRRVERVRSDESDVAPRREQNGFAAVSQAVAAAPEPGEKGRGSSMGTPEIPEQAGSGWAAQPSDRKPVELPRPTLERLPAYHRVVAAAVQAGAEYVASVELGRQLNLDDAQVRRDLSFVWGRGKPGLGYEAAELLRRLEDVLGFNNLADAVLVGAGKLGLAIYGYPGFRAYGLQIVAVFDADPAKVGRPVAAESDQVILPVSKLKALARRMRIQLGIITVPAAQAQQVADALIEAGIRAIWNFAPVTLRVPEHVRVRHEDLAVGLATLQYHLAQAKQRR
jgi:redox-sensing transcriptional repressor